MLPKLLEMKRITKTYPGVVALDKVDFALEYGTIHGLLGENGAGKSTLMKILVGALQPDDGHILINGKEVRVEDPSQAKTFGIHMVYQELCLLPNLTVAENLFIDELPKNKVRLVDWRKLYSLSKRNFDLLKIDIDPKERIKNLSIAKQQLVAISKALSGKYKILILDEPTSALSAEDTENLFKIIELLKREQIGIIFISHKLEEIKYITDMVTILRDSELIESRKTSEVTSLELAELVVGKVFGSKYYRDSFQVGEEILRVENLSLPKKLSNINLSLKKGEILGVCGGLGAGKTDIARCIFGAMPNQNIEGKIFFLGEELNLKSPADAIKRGMGLVPENRAEQGLFLKLNIRTNITISALKNLVKLGFLKLKEESNLIDTLVQKLQIKLPSVMALVKNLSGGNQQKVVIAKWLATKIKMILLDEPTRGLDIGAKVEVYKFLNDMVKEGIGIILFSSEAQETYAMSDRIIVLRDGIIVANLIKDQTSEHELQNLVMTGGN